MDEQRMAQRIDLYQFQIQELEQAGLKMDEEEALDEERLRLMNFHKIFERANIAYSAISDDGTGLDFIGNAMNALEDIVALDSNFKEASEAVTSSFYALQDAAYQVKNVLDDLEYDAERLNEVEQRLALYQTMKRKYGTTVEEILTYHEKIEEELSQLINRDETLQKNEQLLAKMEADLNKIAEQLTTIRKESAIKLSDAIMNELRMLHMEKAQFIVKFEPLNQLDANGKDFVAFYISTNVGEPPKSLPKVASGGELSRMMLALKTIFLRQTALRRLFSMRSIQGSADVSLRLLPKRLPQFQLILKFYVFLICRKLPQWRIIITTLKSRLSITAHSHR